MSCPALARANAHASRAGAARLCLSPEHAQGQVLNASATTNGGHVAQQIHGSACSCSDPANDRSSSGNLVAGVATNQESRKCSGEGSSETAAIC